MPLHIPAKRLLKSLRPYAGNRPRDSVIFIVWWGNRREGDHWGDLGVDGWIILGWISRSWDVGIWTELG